MTKDETDIQIALGTYLPLKWSERNKLIAEGDKLIAEGRQLYAEGDLIYINAVIKVCGKKAIIDWNDGSVKV